MPNITIEVSDETYKSLARAAEDQDRSVADMAAVAVAAQVEAAMRDREETTNAVEQGIRDMEAGRLYSLEEVKAFLEVRRGALEEVRLVK